MLHHSLQSHYSCSQTCTELHISSDSQVPGSLQCDGGLERKDVSQVTTTWVNCHVGYYLYHPSRVWLHDSSIEMDQTRDPPHFDDILLSWFQMSIKQEPAPPGLHNEEILEMEKSTFQTWTPEDVRTVESALSLVVACHTEIIRSDTLTITQKSLLRSVVVGGYVLFLLRRARVFVNSTSSPASGLITKRSLE